MTNINNALFLVHDEEGTLQYSLVVDIDTIEIKKLGKICCLCGSIHKHWYDLSLLIKDELAVTAAYDCEITRLPIVLQEII